MFRLLAIICAIWGFNFVVMKVANNYFSPKIFVVYRFGLGAAIVQYCFKYLSAGMVSVLNYTMPMLVTLLAALFLDEKLTRKKIFGVALSIIGVAVLMGVDVSGDFPSMLLALAAVACLLYNAVIASALAFFLWVFVLEHMQASKASIAVLGEPLSLSILLGMAMVLSGIVIVRRS